MASCEGATLSSDSGIPDKERSTGRQTDEFDIYFARAALHSWSMADNETTLTHNSTSNPAPHPPTTINIHRCPASPRRSVSCKYPSRPGGTAGKRTKSTSGPSADTPPRESTSPYSSLSSSQVRINDNSLCAPLLGAWMKSSSAPQSRSSSWKKLKRPRSFRELSDTRASDQGGSGATNGGTSGSASNLEAAIIDKLNQLKLLQEDDCCVVRSFCTSSKGIVSRGDMYRRIGCGPFLGTPVADSVERDNEAYVGTLDSVEQQSVYRITVHSPSYRVLPDVVCPTEVLRSQTKFYRVLVLGLPHVGKTALIQQFMTSQYMAAVCTSFGR